MRVFVTGATGFIGSAVVPELLAAGHEVLGLARSDSAATTLVDAGATALRGTLTDPEALRAGAADTDGVLHLAIARGDVDFTDTLDVDRRALAALGAALQGSDRPLVFASATSMIEPGRVVTERDAGDTASPTSRGRAENAVLELAVGACGSRSCVSRHWCTATATGTGSCPCWWRGPAPEGSRPTSATGTTGGRVCTASTPPACSASRSRARPRAAACTRSPTRASPSTNSPGSSETVSASPPPASTPTRPSSTSPSSVARSRPCPAPTSRLPARSPASSSTGIPPAPMCSPTCTAAITSTLTRRP